MSASTVTITAGGKSVEMTGEEFSQAATRIAAARGRDVKKTSWDGKRVLVRWEVSRIDGIDEFEMSSADQPAEELTAALVALRPRVAEICQLPEAYCADMEIRGASFSYGGEGRVMGATITALKPVTTANAPLVLNTPHLASDSYTEDGEADKALSTAAIGALENLHVEALRYVDGHRAQRDLFAPPIGKPSVALSESQRTIVR